MQNTTEIPLGLTDNHTHVEKRLFQQVLLHLHQEDELECMVRKILLLLQDYLSFDSVGFRLSVGDDFPYCSTLGFSDEFVKAECFLCARDSNGKLVKSVSGVPILECMCGNIIQGRTDATFPFFTKFGSFWCNHTTELLATTTEMERQSKTRNVCNTAGYETVALIPLRTSKKTIGLIQLNDTPKGKLTVEDIHLLEVVASNIAITIERRFPNADAETSTPAVASGKCNRENFCGMIGTSDKMNLVYKQIKQHAKYETTILISGQTGTGKELVSRAIHAASKRRREFFVPINCGSISPTLLESELFGHIKGAYTGADKQRDGVFASAHGGTVFLDEIEAASVHTQIALLRVLDHKEVVPLGSSTPIPLDVRIIAATNQDLESLIAKGEFREDLYYRLTEGHIVLPPLKDRASDISELAQYFFQFVSNDIGKKEHELSPRALEVLMNYEWPGNVRELRNLIFQLAQTAPRPMIQPHDLPNSFDQHKHAPAVFPTLAEQELELLIRALRLHKGNKSEAARTLGISRTSLYTLIRKHKLKSAAV